MRDTDALGRLGESIACRFLESQRLRVIDRNWRCPEGELDIVALDGRTLVVVEVKTRSSAAFGSPAEAVGHAKAARLRRLAARWAEAHRCRPQFDAGWDSIRLDVVAIVCPAHGEPEIEHFPGVL